jgi:hypothetical protein
MGYLIIAHSMLTAQQMPLEEKKERGMLMPETNF